jgi:hypothetical protein
MIAARLHHFTYRAQSSAYTNNTSTTALTGMGDGICMYKKIICTEEVDEQKRE